MRTRAPDRARRHLRRRTETHTHKNLRIPPSEIPLRIDKTLRETTAPPTPTTLQRIVPTAGMQHLVFVSVPSWCLRSTFQHPKAPWGASFNLRCAPVGALDPTADGKSRLRASWPAHFHRAGSRENSSTQQRGESCRKVVSVRDLGERPRSCRRSTSTRGQEWSSTLCKKQSTRRRQCEVKQDPPITDLTIHRRFLCLSDRSLTHLVRRTLSTTWGFIRHGRRHL